MMTPALLRRLEAAGFEPGSENPTAWAVGRAEAAKEAEELLIDCWRSLAIQSTDALGAYVFDGRLSTAADIAERLCDNDCDDRHRAPCRLGPW